MSASDKEALTMHDRTPADTRAEWPPAPGTTYTLTLGFPGKYMHAQEYFVADTDDEALGHAVQIMQGRDPDELSHLDRPHPGHRRGVEIWVADIVAQGRVVNTEDALLGPSALLEAAR